MKYKNIFYCANVPGKNAGNRREYLIENTENLLTFHYQLAYSRSDSLIEKFSNGKLVWRRKIGIYRGESSFLRYAIYYLVFLYLILFETKPKTFVIITNPIFLIFNSVFKFTKETRMLFWIEDYFPPSKSFFMKLYNFLVNYYNKNLDYVLYLSPPVAKIYNQANSKSKFRREVQLGIKRIKIKKFPRGKYIIVGFIGIIRKDQGLDLMFEYLRKSENIRLELIGEGYDSEYYKEMANKMGINNKVIFYGSVDDPKKIIQTWNIAIALYHKNKENFSKYSEPSKIKSYISYGLPVITTKLTYFYKELEKYNAGEIINENSINLGIAITIITKNYDKYLVGIKKLQVKYEYGKWYSKKLDFLLE